jgi:hypothetical protein
MWDSFINGYSAYKGKMKKLLLILVLAVMSSNVMAEYKEWYKDMLRVTYLGNGITVDVESIFPDIDNKKCDQLTEFQEYFLCSASSSKYKERLMHPVVKENVKSLYESKIEKILGLKVIESNQISESTLHLKVKIDVRQARRSKFQSRDHYHYSIRSTVELKERAISFTGKLVISDSFLDITSAIGYANEEGSIEGEIYKTIDKNLGDIKKYLEKAREFCIKEKCTIEKVRESAKE